VNSRQAQEVFLSGSQRQRKDQQAQQLKANKMSKQDDPFSHLKVMQYTDIHV